MPVSPRHATGLSRTVLRFFLTSAMVLIGAFLLARILMSTLGRPQRLIATPIPLPFLASTFCLGLGSIQLHRAVHAVKREKQLLFRRRIRFALACGTLFLGIQLYGLWMIFPPHRGAEEASLGTTAFTMVLVTLHALHFFVAVLFVCFIDARARDDRYDHEYYWGVIVCAWFWHFLGIVWFGILCVCLIAM